MKKVAEGLKKEVENVKNVLDEHLSAINENTSEIQALFDYLHVIETKVDKLSQRIDNVQLSGKNESSKPIIEPLNHTEKKIFLTLYTEDTPVSYGEIAERAQVPLSIVQDALSSLSVKGIPLLRTLFNNKLFVKIDPQFKELQAKENLINLSLESFFS